MNEIPFCRAKLKLQVMRSSKRQYVSWGINSLALRQGKGMAVARNLCAGGQARGAPVTPVSRGVWGHAPPEKFEI